MGKEAGDVVLIDAESHDAKRTSVSQSVSQLVNNAYSCCKMYNGQTSRMCRGTKEGDTLRSLLFNLVLRQAMEKILESRNLASQLDSLMTSLLLDNSLSVLQRMKTD